MRGDTTMDHPPLFPSTPETLGGGGEYPLFPGGPSLRGGGRGGPLTFRGQLPSCRTELVVSCRLHYIYLYLISSGYK